MTQVRRPQKPASYGNAIGTFALACGLLFLALMLFRMDAFHDRQKGGGGNIDAIGGAGGGTGLGAPDVATAGLHERRPQLNDPGQLLRDRQRHVAHDPPENPKRTRDDPAREAEEEEQQQQQQQQEEEDVEVEKDEEQEEVEDNGTDVAAAAAAKVDGGPDGGNDPKESRTTTTAAAASADGTRRYEMRLGGLTVDDGGSTTTTTGTVVLETHRAWAPLGADHFHALVAEGFYDETRFFRTVPKFVVQFGIAADPSVGAEWRTRRIADDPVLQTNARGTLVFATSGPGTRTTQLFLNIGRRNAYLDKEGFAPFGRVVSGMEFVDRINHRHREEPKQHLIAKSGNGYLNEEFPDLSYIVSLREIHETTDQRSE